MNAPILLLALLIAVASCKMTVDEHIAAEAPKYALKQHQAHTFSDPTTMVNEKISLIVAVCVIVLFSIALLTMTRFFNLKGFPHSVLRKAFSGLFIVSISSIVVAFILYWVSMDLKWLLQAVPVVSIVAVITGRLAFK
ncbi:hypothetical protein J8273_2129 [Carpediemonas membranifera]|uniref:Ribophorin II C-terminal domain-containing protein n=1 Tax=Carpediemonas membranifera TaxID=201153 RepID=A0A8J6E3U6_9EUKA|nr:hypothetical protein J8273_2129 [Carpediemonas membranifera]|eukprot:KAG9396398.1 hypothetical protein J8273_2129 [Carpediemonas membranifera]